MKKLNEHFNLDEEVKVKHDSDRHLYEDYEGPDVFPPSDNFVVTRTLDGEPLNSFKDSIWDYREEYYDKGVSLNWGDRGISGENLALIKSMFLFSSFHPKLFTGNYRTLSPLFQILCLIGRVCSENGVLVNEFSRFPHLWPLVGERLPKHKKIFNVRIGWLHRIYAVREKIGFSIANDRCIAILSRFKPDREGSQIAYIPPRIWTYQLLRLNQLVDDFLNHKENLIDAFSWINKAYKNNVEIGIKKYPFGWSTSKHKINSRLMFWDGNFNSFCGHFKILELYERWMINPGKGVQSLRALLSTAKHASLLYIMNYSLQRSGEIRALNSDCFVVENDPKIGNIALIIGETTKTDPDSDARWVVPKHVGKAVECAKLIADLGEMLGGDYDTNTVKGLFYNSVGIKSGIHARNIGFTQIAACSNSKVFDPKELEITEEDYRIALTATPTLTRKSWFKVGNQWKFSNHQLRRTLCMNMFSSNMISDSTIQWQMKHCRRHMTLYYARNYSRVKLNGAAELMVIMESYEKVYRDLAEAVTNDLQWVFPNGTTNRSSQLLNLILEDEEHKVKKMINDQRVGCREMMLGVCMNVSCKYGGIESMAKCAGVDENKPCKDAIFDRKKKVLLNKLKKRHLDELPKLPVHSPRYSFLAKEIHAIEIYENVTKG